MLKTRKYDSRQRHCKKSFLQLSVAKKPYLNTTKLRVVKIINSDLSTFKICLTKVNKTSLESAENTSVGW